MVPVGSFAVSSIPIIVQFRPLIDLIQKFRLSDSTIDQHYSLNSVDVVINGANAGPQIPYPTAHQGGRPDFFTPPTHPAGQFVWVPRESYVKPAGGNKHIQGGRSQDRNRDKGYDKDRSSSGGNRDRKRSTDDRSDRNSRGDNFYRGDEDSSKRDRDQRPRGDSSKSASEGGDKKRDRPSSSRDHQAASMTVASGDENRDDSDDSSSSEGSN